MTLHDPVCSARRFSPMKSKLGASTPVGIRRFVTTDLRARQSTAAVAPIDSNSASVAVTAAAAAYWGSTSPHSTVARAQVPSPAGARMPFNADTQITIDCCRFFVCVFASKVTKHYSDSPYQLIDQ
jgi:hypothetical protein